MDGELSVRTEAIGDIPLLMGIIQELKIAEAIDSCIKVDGHWQGISVGTVVSLWLCYRVPARISGLMVLPAGISSTRRGALG